MPSRPVLAIQDGLDLGGLDRRLRLRGCEALGNPNGTVTVNYATSNGTAVAGKDYTAAAGILTFPPQATDEIFSIAILPNPSQTASSVTVDLAPE